MPDFMSEDFLLMSPTAQKLYHGYAESMPVVDYHCHINAKDIYEDTLFENIAQLWLGIGGTRFGDHYKWRLMRSCGVEEDYISGSAPDEVRFQKWAQCLGRAVGNPLYHWSHMELRKYFGYDGVLNENTAKEVWEYCNQKLKDPSMSVRSIIARSNVKLICTTDDPSDSLEWHIKIAQDPKIDTLVYPAMRPDRVKNIEAPDYLDYLNRLSVAGGAPVCTFEDLKECLRRRMDFFETLGCRLSDHAFEFVPYTPGEPGEAERIFAARLTGKIPSRQECGCFYTALMCFLGEEYSRRNWVMQLHYGCKRNNNTEKFYDFGPDTGYDCIGDSSPISQLVSFLDALEREGHLPKTILYSLSPSDNAAIDSVIGCFQDASAVSKIQHGAAWWFNDHIPGIRDHLISLASQGNLAGFVGMLTDSRSFLSYTRHDYFRRILCQLLGEWVEAGEFPYDMNLLGEIVRDISYNNSVRYFGFPLETVQAGM